MATVEDFILKINVQGEGAVKNLSGTIQNLSKDAQAFGSGGGGIFSNTLGSITSKLGGTATAVLGVAGAIAALGLKAVQIADQLQDISDASGIAAGALSNLQSSIIEAGGKADDFANIATKLNQTLGDAAMGNEAAQKSFQKLGVFVRDANGEVRDTGDVLRDVLGKLAAVSDPATRAALAVELLGKKGKEIDWTKVNAVNDPFKDEYVAALARFQGKLDSINNSVKNGLLTTFGELFLLMEEGFAAPRLDGYLANFQAMISGMTAAEVLEQQRKNRVALGLEKPLAPGQRPLTPGTRPSNAGAGRGGQGGPTAAQLAGAGDFGAIPEATLKAIAESQKRIAQSGIEARKYEQLKGSNDLQAIEVNAAAEIAKAREEIFAKERLTDTQKAAEFAAKTAEIEQKAAGDTAKYRSQQNAKIYSELEAQRQKAAEELAAEETRINAIVEKTRQLVVEQGKLVEQTKDRNRFNNEIALLSDRERANRKEIFDLEEQRKKVVDDIKNTSDLPYADQLEKIKGINAQFEERKRLTVEQQAADLRLSENFQAGFQRAYANYAESARNAFDQANTYFTTFTRGFEDAWVKMIQTGKFGWKDLVSTMIAELARAQIRGTLSNLFGAVSGAGGGGNGGLFGGSIIPGFLASGGSATAGKPYVVGEQGPELFIPRTSGTVIPNGSFGSSGGSSNMVTYNINAVDAPSFKAMIARDPSFIHAVAMQGAAGIPSRR